MTGRLIKAIAGFYYVDIGDSVLECKARGAFRKDHCSPLVGDVVEITRQNGNKGVLEEIGPRSNRLVRPPMANVARMFLVSSTSIPAPNTLLIDRQIVLCERKGIEPILVFNKVDEAEADRLVKLYTKAGFLAFATSAQSGQGVDQIREALTDGINVFAGNSGVGKSSLLNLLLPEKNLATGEVSEKLGRGRHTTRAVELFKIGDAYVADTPGFSNFDLETCDTVYKEELADAFREFRPFLGTCRFTSCSHTCEKGCAVLSAVEHGEISSERHENYQTLYREIKDIKPWQAK